MVIRKKKTKQKALLTKSFEFVQNTESKCLSDSPDPIIFWVGEKGIAPTKATEKSVGWDVSSPINFTVPAEGFYLLDTDIVVDFSSEPAHLALHLLPRSSLFKKKGLLLANSVGLFEPDYCGPQDTIRVALFNPAKTPVEIFRGERIAQFYFFIIYQVDLLAKESLGCSFLSRHHKAEIRPLKDNKNKIRGGVGSSGGYKN